MYISEQAEMYSLSGYMANMTWPNFRLSQPTGAVLPVKLQETVLQPTFDVILYYFNQEEMISFTRAGPRRVVPTLFEVLTLASSI
jgi:hypothetical protein